MPYGVGMSGNEGAGAGAPDDPTRVSDISYYRDSALSKLLASQAAERARRARREAFVLVPLVALVIVLWALREELFGTDVPVRIAAAILLGVIGWRFARDVGRAMGPRLLARSDPGTASTVAFLVQLLTLVVVTVVALRLVDLDPRAIAVGDRLVAARAELLHKRVRKGSVHVACHRDPHRGLRLLQGR